MEYRKVGEAYLVRMDPGEEILEQLERFARQEQIRLAAVQALGAVKEFTVGVFKTDEKKYYANHFSGSFEIAPSPAPSTPWAETFTVIST